MYEVTVLYKHPQNEEAFEKYYEETHLPLAKKIPNMDHAEFTKFVPAPDGKKAVYYRMAELYFTTRELMAEALKFADGQAAAEDIP
jgi:uncharacterized protein (TIGR02118 family)